MAGDNLSGETRVCKKCQRDLPLTEDFYRPQFSGKVKKVVYRHVCRECIREGRWTPQEKRKGRGIFFVDGDLGKTCRGCKKDLPISAFYFKGEKGGKPGIYHKCKECCNAESRKRHHEVYGKDPIRKKRARERGAEWYRQNGERARLKNRVNARLQKLRCLAHYGGACACCGEARVEFLAMDHVDGDGYEHRKKCGSKIYHWLVKNNFPSEPRLRVLCHNCNMAIGFYGFCPHQLGPSALENGGGI